MSAFKTVFVTGGAGYIGSHCIVDLLEAGYHVVAIDNFANCRGGNDEAPSLKRVEEITGKKVTFHKCDLLDADRLEELFTQYKIDCVIHFAAMKSVGESMEHPLLYYKNNVGGTINLIEVMKRHSVYQLVFSSSCTVYGDPVSLPITESHPLPPVSSITNVYGRTKLMMEVMMQDLSHADKNWNIISLRYFNPVGAHPSGLIGEDPTKPYTNLMPYIAQVAIGNKPHVTIYGNDYNTPDGTGVRDYIHVMDLASGHLAALKKLQSQHLNWSAMNMGVGKGLSVLELCTLFEQVSGKKVNYVIGERRPYNVDLPTLYCDSSLAQNELNWKATRDHAKMCEDFWRWQTQNPKGYNE